MSRLRILKKAKNKHDLAALLGFKVASLTYILYKVRPENQYYQFQISKRSGGTRTISAPSDQLKRLQSSLSSLLLDCIDELQERSEPELERFDPSHKYSEILKVKVPSAKTKQLSLSHGFSRDRSIITNAMMHLNKKNVLNIDLDDFFGSITFPRVRGFFIKNRDFELEPSVATIIAQIACYNGKLPQGSPSSPVISNLIANSLDIRLAALANRYSCTYSRYADDLTFSTRKIEFPEKIMKQVGELYIPGKRLRSEIRRSGFEINHSKTRLQYQNSRQDVTGLVVNKKPNVRKEYWRTVRAQCHSLFHRGYFTKTVGRAKVRGNINELEGQLNFIDQVDQYNRLRQKPPLDPIYAVAKHGVNTLNLLTGREKTLSKFLYYRLFYGNDKPTILCEGQTDNVYLKSALSKP